MRIIQFILLVLLFSSCARSYHPVNHQYLRYDNRKIAGPLEISYVYDVHRVMRNRPYVRKERKKGFSLVGIRIRNLGNDPVTITRENFKARTQMGRIIAFLDAESYVKEIRQYPEQFILFYGLAGIGFEFQSSSHSGTSATLTYSPLPLIVGIGNAIFAGGANSKMRKDIELNDIFNRTIPPRDIIYGVIAIPEGTYPELEFQYGLGTYLEFED